MSQPSDLEALIAYCKAKGACPRAFEWSVMFKLLDGFGREEKHEQVPWPLILGAWHFSSDGEKHERFLLHLHIANERGLLPAVDKYLRSLTLEQWNGEPVSAWRESESQAPW